MNTKSVTAILSAMAMVGLLFLYRQLAMLQRWEAIFPQARHHT
jgi:hypothetical protein